MGATLRSVLTKEQRQNKTLELYLRGWSQRKIAKELGCGSSAINRDILQIREDWRKSRTDAIGHELFHELARIDAIEREAWAQWESSKKEEVTNRVETEFTVENLPNGGTVRKNLKEKAHRTTRIRNADPRYMETIRWYVEQRCKLLGLLAPTTSKAILTGPDGSSPPKITLDLSQLSDDELDALDKVRNRMLGVMPGTGSSLN